ncbi:MAG TPA: LapA family protein [Candidatus Atribacteria bacterium]|nr:LapA family protein [Candidatus Atribacteria bacterium]
MQFYLILAAIIAISMVIFSFQNPFPLMVYFLGWEVKISLTLILIITFIAGILTCFLVTTISRMKRTRLITRQKKKIAELTKEEIK